MTDFNEDYDMWEYLTDDEKEDIIKAWEDYLEEYDR